MNLNSPTEFKQQVSKILDEKSRESIETRKQEVSKTVFNSQVKKDE